MAIPAPVQFMGVPGSPYTRKMLALMRYRHIAYKLLLGNQAFGEQPGGEPLPKPRVSLLPTFFLPDDNGQIEAVVDSTPLARRFEAEFRGRSAIPPDPVLGFLNYLVEDYGDEWLTKAMFHYRWQYEEDIERSSQILPRWTHLDSSDEELRALADAFAERQIGRLYVVGSNEVTAPVIEASYARFLALFDRLIERQIFVFGSRPSTADFALYAQLTQLAGFDPTPTAKSLTEAPRVYAWVQVVDDLSGNPASDDGWIDRSMAKEALAELLAEIGRVYTPVLLANAQAITAGEETLQTTVDGQPWEQPVFPYQAKCLGWIRDEYAALSADDQRAVDTILAGTGCEPLLAA